MTKKIEIKNSSFEHLIQQKEDKEDKNTPSLKESTDLSTQEEDYLAKLEEYFRLQSSYQSSRKTHRKGCIKCRNSAGTFFNTTRYHYTAKCAAKTPCSFNINLYRGNFMDIRDMLHHSLRETREAQESLILEEKKRQYGYEPATSPLIEEQDRAETHLQLYEQTQELHKRVYGRSQREIFARLERLNDMMKTTALLPPSTSFLPLKEMSDRVALYMELMEAREKWVSFRFPEREVLHRIERMEYEYDVEGDTVVKSAEVAFSLLVVREVPLKKEEVLISGKPHVVSWSL